MFVDTEMKNRPQTLNDFVFANDGLEQEIRAYCSGKTTRPLILYGSYGTGKSLLAELIPKEIEGFSPQVEYVCAFDFRNKREVLAKFSRNKQFDELFTVNGQRFNYFVLEEMDFDAATSKAFRVVLDDYRGTDITIITTNEIEKIDSAIKSRSEVIEVPPVPPERFLQRAKAIIAGEGININEDALLDALDAIYVTTQVHGIPRAIDEAWMNFLTLKS